MGKRIEAIKRVQQSSPSEVLASFLLRFVVNGEEHFYKTDYYDCVVYFELNNENNAYMIDVLYLGQETSFPLSTFMRQYPDYKSVLAITPQLLEWMDATYAAHCPPEPVKPKRGRSGRVANRQQVANYVMDMRAQNTPQKDTQPRPRKRAKR